MPVQPWFASDDPETESELDGAERAFVAVLRERAGAWALAPAVSWVARPEDDSSLVVCAGVGDGPLGWPLRVGLHLSGATVRGDRFAHQNFYWLTQPPTGLALNATGSPEALAVASAAWFERVLRMPVVRHEWYHEGRLYAYRCLFAGDGDGDGWCDGYRDALAPPGQRERLVAAGALDAGYWVRSGALGRPDRVVVLRGTPG
ncbi:hypothetical protein ABZW03_36390 [Kitasatospora sp. NPDC004799]|uniref:hypothetical protein n=1 Tax=Kitasatospora sp. NPDC004799 TaxID=3154460 RepID=UPI0033A0ED86